MKPETQKPEKTAKTAARERRGAGHCLHADRVTFVGECEMAEIEADAELQAGRQRGCEDAAAGRGRFVAVRPSA